MFSPIPYPALSHTGSVQVGFGTTSVVHSDLILLVFFNESRKIHKTQPYSLKKILKKKKERNVIVGK